MVKADAGLRTLADFGGKTISVVEGTTNERALRLQIKVRGLNVTVLPVKSADEGYAALGGGRADAFASDKLLLVGAASRGKDAGGLAVLPEDLSFEPYSIALPRNDSALRLAVNTGLSKIYGSGEISDIYNRWFSLFGKPCPVLEALYILGSVPE